MSATKLQAASAPRIYKGQGEYEHEHVVRKLNFPLHGYNVHVLSITPKERAGEQGENHAHRLRRITDYTRAWTANEVELLIRGETSESGLLAGLLWKIWGGVPQVDGIPEPGTSAREGPASLNTYVNLRILYHVTPKGDLDLLATVAETRNVLTPNRDVILHRQGGQPVAGILYNEWNELGSENNWTRRILSYPIMGILGKEIVPYSTPEGAVKKFAPALAIGLDAKL